MKEKKLDTIVRSSDIGNKEKVYLFEDIKKVADNLEVLIPEVLIVSRDGKSDCWLDFTFFEWYYGADEGDYYKELCRVSGPSGPLRECRHTYFADKGYIFYMNRQIIVSMVDYLTLYYDMD